jgi:hypothetical protein
MRQIEAVRRVLGYGLAMFAMTLICTSPGLVSASVNEDDSITNQVKSALAADPSLGKRQIVVNTYKGRVQLTGFVQNQREKGKAVELAGNVETVMSVQDNLMIEQGPGPHIIPRLNNWQSPGP